MLPLLDGKRCTTHVKFIIFNFLKGDGPAWPAAWPVAMNFIVAMYLILQIVVGQAW